MPPQSHAHFQACFSPDGRLVLCGSEEGSISVWDAEPDFRTRAAAAPPLPPPQGQPLFGGVGGGGSTSSSPLVASLPRRPSPSLSGMAFNAPLLCVAWNPTQHAVALGASGGPYPVLLACADRPLDDEPEASVHAGRASAAAAGFFGDSGGGGGGESFAAAGSEEGARLAAARVSLLKREKVRAKLDHAKAASNAAAGPAANARHDNDAPERESDETLLPGGGGFAFGGAGAAAVAEGLSESAAGSRGGLAQEPRQGADVASMGRTAPVRGEEPSSLLPSMSKTAPAAVDPASF